MNLRRLRVGVVGTGQFAESCHIPGLLSHPQADVVALCGRSPDKLRDMARRHGIPSVHTDFGEICRRDDIDAVTIATPNVEHSAQACAALAAGKHVFCEKPLAMTLDEAREMACVAERSKGVHQVGFTYRYLYGVRELRRRVLRGDIGRPIYIRAQFDSWEGLHPNYKVGARQKLKLAGGGMLFDVGSHLFDITRHILGPIEAVWGFSKLIPRQRPDSRTGELAEIETDDFSAVCFVHENGVHGQWFASRVTPPLAERSYLEVIGQEGALRASLSRGSVDGLRVSTPMDPAWKEVRLPDQAYDQMPHCLGLMMKSFVDACFRGKLDSDVDASFHDGLAAQLGLSVVEKMGREPMWVRLEGGVKSNSQRS